MGYNYEMLGPERFQHFCQAILAAKFPNVQCLPVGQPDGGRDAFLWQMYASGQSQGVVIFQVKFSRSPDNEKDERAFVEKIAAQEGPKIARLLNEGVKAYYLLTNVRGTAHSKSGSIDRVNRVLTKAMGATSYCWWRDDLDRRVDAHSDIKWSFPEIIRGSDLLQALLEGKIGEDARRRSDAITSYLAAQYMDDEDVRFRQVELQNKLIDLFVDLPVRVISSGRGKDLEWQSAQAEIAEREGSLLDIGLSAEGSIDYVGTNRVRISGAAGLLLSASTPRGLQLVLEGAPGQGKSTITQYVCQVHRMRLINKVDVSRLPGDHIGTEVKVPLRVDLRDYAAWLGRKNPFGGDQGSPLPPDYNAALERFLAFQIAQYSGGFDFSVADLSAIAKNSRMLIVLDGFDEIADIPTRTLVVEEISKAATRIRANAKLLDVFVTSRPAAFANSPGFPERDWMHLEIQAMTSAQIDSYAQKWATARHLPAKENFEFRRVLKAKLEEPHMRDLARNPMQLAILLALIHTRGHSLPDKRTALYDNYTELFFSREAEKSAVVLEHRELLLRIHRFLAWVLHVEAEEGRGGGSISEEQFRQTLRAYLLKHGHNTDLVDVLFTGMVERVVVLGDF